MCDEALRCPSLTEREAPIEYTLNIKITMINRREPLRKITPTTQTRIGCGLARYARVCAR